MPIISEATKDLDRIKTLYHRISGHIHTARSNVIRSVNTEQIRAYWLIGRDIVEEEQSGAERADYGQAILKLLSERLTQEFGKGFGISTLTHIRKFYLTYQLNEKSYAVRTISDEKSYAPRSQSQPPEFKHNLGWTHYRSLMRINDEKARKFYEIEASKNNWSSRELDRQIGSLLYDRLALSKDKAGLLKLSCEGQEINSPEDAIKEPLILEFLGIPESHKLVESKLEEALITHLQSFLLELGRGFAFVGRQQRLTIDGDHFYVDLVFYHVVLKRYILVDLKTKPVTHADLGQIQLYRNYYDMECLTEGDHPTIGLILCTEKNQKMVKYFVGKDEKNIFASKFKLVLPSEKELEVELKKEMRILKQRGK